MDKRLVRSEKDGEVAGVAWGLAQYFDVDVTLVRIAFVLLTLAGGPGILIYIAMWIAMPDISKDQKDKNDFTDA